MAIFELRAAPLTAFLRLIRFQSHRARKDAHAVALQSCATLSACWRALATELIRKTRQVRSIVGGANFRPSRLCGADVRYAARVAHRCKGIASTGMCAVERAGGMDHTAAEKPVWLRSWLRLRCTPEMSGLEVGALEKQMASRGSAGLCSTRFARSALRGRASRRCRVQVSDAERFGQVVRGG
jgi:hypothetical protein